MAAKSCALLQAFAGVVQNQTSHVAEDPHITEDRLNFRLESVLLALTFELAFLWCAALWVWKGRKLAAANEEPVDKRIALYDTAKAVCILCVVIWHWTLGVIFGSYQYDGLERKDFSVRLVSNFTGNWMMSLFCIVSGICSQGPPTFKRFQSYLQYLVVPSFLWIGFFHKIFLQLFANKPVMPGGNFASHEWYLASLIMWRGASLLFFHRLHPMALFLLSQVVSLSAGYIHSDCAEPGLDWCSWYNKIVELDCTLGWLPHFVLGYILPMSGILRAVPKPSRHVQLGALFFVICWSYSMNPAFGGRGGGDPHINYFDAKPHWLVPAELDSQWGYRFFWAHRLTTWGVMTLPALVMLILVLPRTDTFLTWIGPNTMSAYMFHPMLLRLCTYFTPEAVRRLPQLIVHSVWFPTFVVALHILLCYAIVALLSSEAWQRTFHWLLKPKWLDSLPDFLVGLGSRTQDKTGCLKASSLDVASQ